MASLLHTLNTFRFATCSPHRKGTAVKTFTAVVYSTHHFKNIWIVPLCLEFASCLSVEFASLIQTVVVVLQEPKDNGPLFTEMHFYMNAAKPDISESH